MAWPATSESDPLYLMAATSASTAASNWIGPSMGYSLHRLLAFEVASRIVSMSAPWFESPDAYESMATRGSTPNCLAVCADATYVDNVASMAWKLHAIEQMQSWGRRRGVERPTFDFHAGWGFYSRSRPSRLISSCRPRHS